MVSLVISVDMVLYYIWRVSFARVVLKHFGRKHHDIWSSIRFKFLMFTYKYFKVKAAVYSSDCMANIAQKVERYHLPIVAGIIGSLATYKVVRLYSKQSTVSEFPKDKKYTPSVYQPNKRMVSCFDTGRSTGSYKNLSREDIAEKLAPNIFLTEVIFNTSEGSRLS